MSSNKNVKFREDSDTGGSRTSSHVSSHASSHASRGSSNGHHRSDSGSLSDYDNNGLPADYAAQKRLRDSVKHACAERDQWKAKAHVLEQSLAKERTESADLEARWRGMINLNENLESDKKKLLSDKKILQEDNRNLKDENTALRERIERLEKKLNRASNSPPASMSAMPVRENTDKVNAKVHRSTSRARRERALSEAEEAEKDKARLSKRFERSDGSSDGRSDNRSDTTAKEQRRRRRDSTTYVEPMGPPAARPAAPVPPSPTRHYPTYTTSPNYAAQYSSIREPTMSAVPRSVKHPSSSSTIHPKVLVQSPRYDESPFHPDEDGSYFPHPLPREPRR